MRLGQLDIAEPLRRLLEQRQKLRKALTRHAPILVVPSQGPGRRTAAISSMIAGSSIVGGHARTSRPAAMSRIVARRILPERVFGRRATTRASRKQATGADALAHERHELVAQLARVALGARLEHHEPERHLAAQLVGDAEHGALGDVRVRRHDLLHRARSRGDGRRR